MIDENDFDMSRNDASSHTPRSPLQNSAMKNDSSDHVVSFDKTNYVVTSHYTPTNFSVNSAIKDNSVRLTPVFEHNSDDNGVGHMSHIPRKPPTPSTYTVPSCVNNSFGTDHNTGVDLFGMIKLKDNDVCYTSGSIEWVGRKRSYPINSGFKIINESLRQGNEPCLKRVRRLDNTFTIGDDKIKECDCANVLPTVNAIVDHLNALHEAVDLVDLRLNNIEDNVDKN